MERRKELRRTPLAPMSPKRARELAEAGIPALSTFAGSRASFGRSAPILSVRRPAATGPDREVVAAVLERDGFSCVVCGRGLCDRRGIDYSIHHRLRRSQGLDNSMPNLAAMCGSGTTGDHGGVHARPKWARDAGGWLLRRADDPATYPMLVERGARWVLLTADGRYETTSAPEGWAA